MKRKMMLPENLAIFLKEHQYLLREIRKRHKDRFRKMLSQTKGKSLSIQNEDLWIKKMNRLMYAMPELVEVAEAFCQCEIQVLQHRDVSPSDIVSICVQKNDLVRMKNFIHYHRALGIDKFVVLDNDSHDGSVEWLMNQTDVVLLQTKQPYTTNRREGWINRIMAHYGDSRWYLVLDSDELLTYTDCEHHSIKELIAYLETHRMVRARAMMLDMYAPTGYYEKGNKEGYLEECRYFDTDTYTCENRIQLDLIKGGCRGRIFTEIPWLTKYPLFYLRHSDLECKSHFLYPFKANKHCSCQLVLRHYKFLAGDIEKIRSAVQSGNYYAGSKQYISYLKVLESGKPLDFQYDRTAEYKSSDDLKKINVYDGIDWQA